VSTEKGEERSTVVPHSPVHCRASRNDACGPCGLSDFYFCVGSLDGSLDAEISPAVIFFRSEGFVIGNVVMREFQRD
jgi:hypothetical protein